MPRIIQFQRHSRLPSSLQNLTVLIILEKVSILIVPKWANLRFWDYPVLIDSEENQSGHSVLWDCILDPQNLVLVQNSKYDSLKSLIHLAGILKNNLRGLKRYYQDTNSFKRFPASSFSILQSFWKAVEDLNPLPKKTLLTSAVPWTVTWRVSREECDGAVFCCLEWPRSFLWRPAVVFTELTQSHSIGITVLRRLFHLWEATTVLIITRRYSILFPPQGWLWRFYEIEYYLWSAMSQILC